VSGAPLFTIGAAGASARGFCARLRAAGTMRVVDVRLWGTSQMAGFAKRDDLAFLLEAALGISLEHRPECAPTADILKAFKAGRMGWGDYTARYAALLDARGVPDAAAGPEPWAGAALLCACARPEFCHRRVLAERLAATWPGRLAVVHL
jgi:uncharacterized protein (DUF488 family)